MTDNQGFILPDERAEERKKKRTPFFLLAGVALLGAGAFGYWTAGNPPSVVEKAVEQSKAAATPPPETKAVTEPQAPKAEASAPAPETKAAEAPAQTPAQSTVEKQPEPAPVETPEPTAPAAPAQVAAEPAKQPEQQAALQPEAQPEPQPEPPKPVAKADPPAAPEVAAPEAPAPKAEEALVLPDEPAPDSAPSFDTVRVEPTGDAVIAGRGKPGVEVAVKLNGEVIGKATVNAEGSFVIVPDKPLPAGAGALTLEMQDGGKVVSSPSSVAVAVKAQAKGEALVAVIKPDEPVAIVQAPSSEAAPEPAKKVVLDAVDYDDQGNIVFSGRSAPGSTVRIYVDNVPAGEVTTGGTGQWTFNGKTTIAPGTHTLRADEVDKAGKVVSRVELPFLREEAAKVASAQGQTSAETSADTNVATPAIGVKTTAGNNAVPQRIVIQPGNNLWRLSRLVYGKGTRYTVIWEANKGQIRDPDLIYPGQIFAMPVQP